ncbi:MAG: hypothetical protein ACK5KO_00240 [Arachnia sp.]
MLSAPSEVGCALTGQQLPLRAGAADEIARQLTELGWPPERIEAFRDARRAARQPWPIPVSLPAGLGAAQFWAQVTAVRGALGLDTPPAATRSQRPWTAAERQLAAERPPHW